MADDAFVATPYSELSEQSKQIMLANALGSGMTSAEEYYSSRGGVNQAGYYGDSYIQGITLTDAEYKATIDAAIKSGATGGGIGGAINTASDIKRMQFMQQMGFTNQDQLSAYLKGTSELAERQIRLRGEYLASGATTKTYSPTTAPIPGTVSPIPTSPTASIPIAPPPPPAKTAPIDTILYPSDDQLPIEIMADLIFEDIGGQELINIARNDTVNGQQVVYQPIKNLTQIQQQYNPNNIVSLQATSDKYFQNFSIKFDNKVPDAGNGPNGAHVYIDSLNGDLVIEAINIAPDEQIEVEITTSGTIYEAEI